MSDYGSVERLTWRQARDHVKAVNPDLCQLIDALDPPDDHWLLKSSYPYGSSVMERSELMLPNHKGQIVPLTNSSIEADILDGLGYNTNSVPLAVVLNNSFSIFLPLNDRIIPFTKLITAGDVIGCSRLLDRPQSQMPMFIWQMLAGARSTFFLPKITEIKKHNKLKKTFDITMPPPDHLMNQWAIFHALAQSKAFPQPWQASIMYFSKAWLEHQDDIAWQKFYCYWRDYGCGTSQLWRSQAIWDLIFSLILKNYPGRPSGYITNTAEYLMYMATGTRTSFSPATDDLGGPFSSLQAIYRDVYGLTYPPIIMQPSYFDLNDPQGAPTYYSLQYPVATKFKLNHRSRISIISDLHDIRALMIRYSREFSSDKFNIKDTLMDQVFRRVKFDYFHSGVELHAGMQAAELLADGDDRFLTTIDGQHYDQFPESCSFVKGCIRLSHDEKEQS